MILSATFAGLLWTDHGFRRAEDCTAILKLRDWHGGHYWSVRPTHECDDPLYFGKGDGLFVPAPPPPEFALWSPPTEPASSLAQQFAQASVAASTSASASATSSSFGARSGWTTPTTPTPPPTPTVPPIPLPASAWMLMLALGALIWRTR